MFEIPREKTRRRWTVPLTMLGELAVVMILVFMPPKHVQVEPTLVSRMIFVAPGPPPPPPPPAAGRKEPLKIVPRRFDPLKLTAPTRVPAVLAETAMPEAPDIAGITGGIEGGVPGGVLGGIPGGVLGGILTSLPSAPPPPPPVVARSAAAPPSRVTVGGEVEASLLLHEVTPVYPKLARAARIEGTVRLKAIIGCDGRVKDLTLISGQPLLVSAAVEAVRQWVYKPTLLNGLPFEVETEIVVVFSRV